MKIAGPYVSNLKLRTALWERLDQVARERSENVAAERQRLLEAAVDAYLSSPEIEGRLL